MVSTSQQPPGISLLLLLSPLLPRRLGAALFVLFFLFCFTSRIPVPYEYLYLSTIFRRLRSGIRGNLAASSETHIDDNDNRQECIVFFARAIFLYLRWEPPSMLASPCSFATTCSLEDMSVSSHDIVEFLKRDTKRP